MMSGSWFGKVNLTLYVSLQKAGQQKSERDVAMMWSFTVFKIAVTMWNKTNDLQASNLHSNSCCHFFCEDLAILIPGLASPRVNQCFPKLFSRGVFAASWV